MYFLYKLFFTDCKIKTLKDRNNQNRNNESDSWFLAARHFQFDVL